MPFCKAGCPLPASLLQVWSRLPRACQAAWERLQQRSEAGEAPAEAPELRQLLDAFSAGAGVPAVLAWC